jgi:hypothetical protein
VKTTTAPSSSVLSGIRASTDLGTHVELHLSIRTGELIRIACDCPLSADHSYRDWLELPENATLRQSISAPCLL